MHLTFDGVNDAFTGLVRGLYDGSIPAVRRPSRNGGVLQVEEPVTITYRNPLRRVLFNAARDANPFFHLYEALWMLAGRNDVASVASYCARMREYSDDGRTLNGSYGYRWRRAPNHFPVDGTTATRPGEEDPGWQTLDQLDLLVSHLKADPNSRRAVLQMWSVEDDLLRIGRPCDLCEGGAIAPGPHPDGSACPDCGGKFLVDASRDVCCLAGEVKFRSPEGDTDVKTLARRFHDERGYKYPVYTIDPVTGDQRLSWMTAAWKTGVRKTITVKLDDGSSVRLTSNHIVYRKRKTFDGKRCMGIVVSECEAGDLRVGDSLLSELPEDSGCRLNHGYRYFKRNVFLNTNGKNMVKEHRAYYEFATGEHLGSNDVHHVNEIRTDNRLENLERINERDHQRLHKLGTNNPHCKMSSEDKSKRGRVHSAVLRSGGKQNAPPHIREILGVRPPRRSDEQNNDLWDWVCSLSNHKIVAVEDGGYTEVYDFTVPGRHNAVLSNGALVHNCNLSALFSLRVTGSWGWPDDPTAVSTYALDLTVTNRSNDLVWGLLGANVVHFSFLQEYLAARLGVSVGLYHHFTNNLHVYKDNWRPEAWLAGEGDELARPYGKVFPLVEESERFERELEPFVERWTGDPQGESHTLREPFLCAVAEPFFAAHRRYRVGDFHGALAWVDRVAADDWRRAGRAWLERRQLRRGQRVKSGGELAYDPDLAV